MIELTCIVCPRGCHLKVDDDKNVTGNFCPRGKEYALNEITCPKRNITSTVRILNSDSICPVKTSGDIPKDRIFDVMAKIRKAKAKLPVHIGDVIIEDVCKLGVNIVATRNIDK